MSNKTDEKVFNTIILKALEINNNNNLKDEKKKEALIEYVKSLYSKKEEK